MKPVRIAQIGTGHDHAPATAQCIQKHPEDFDFVGIAEPVSANEGNLSGKAYEHIRQYTLAELLAMQELEAVVIEAGKENEVRYAQLFADKGIAIHVDKPGSADLRAYSRFVNTMKEKNLPLSIGYMYRFNPLVQKAEQLAKSGELGDIFSFEAQMSVRHDTEKRRWLGKYKGGMMYFLGCHLIDLMCQFQGFPDEILPLSQSTGNEGLTTGDFGFAVFKYPSGVSFVKTCASEVNGVGRRQLVICGTKGTVEIYPPEGPAPDGDGHRASARVTLLRDAPNQWVNSAATVTSDTFGRYDAMLHHFAQQVRGEAGMLHPYDYETELFRTIIRACGAVNSVYGEDD